MHESTIMICPKCGHSQDEAAECRRCGIVFGKYIKALRSRSDRKIRPPSITIYDSVKENRGIGTLSALVALLALVLYTFHMDRDIRHPPGILVASGPEQVLIRNPNPWSRGARVFVPLAKFRMAARVLSRESYFFDSQADISPVDLALGWGPMSDQRVLDQLDIVQGNRCYAWSPIGAHLPLPWSELTGHSSNMHIIPADEEMKRFLKSVRKGDIIELSGYLVGVQENGHWTWVSSLSRTDTGDGACEIVWVENLVVR